MAIEIRLPETGENQNPESLAIALQHLVPVIISYCISFFFIGVVWYQHLKMFSLLKDYDKGLVIRNLVLLFFVSLFPFSSSIITREHAATFGFFIYMAIILLSIIAQLVLYQYILEGRTGIRLNIDIGKQLEELGKRKISAIGFALTFVLIAITYIIIPRPELKTMSTIWMALFPLAYRWMIRRKRKKEAMRILNQVNESSE